MNNVTTYPIGQGYPAQIRKAEKTAPTVTRVRTMDATPKRRRRNQKGQATAVDPFDVADGFLKTTFLPKLEENKTVQATQENTQLERDFYKSLSQLADHYAIEPMPTRQHTYPYNIALAMWDTERLLRAKLPCYYGLEIVREDNRHFLQSDERFDIGTTLYYIPVVPIFMLSRNGRTKKTATLLFSICCYLWRMVDIPYYRDGHSYIAWQYEMLEEWVASDDQTDETETYRREFSDAGWLGDLMGQKLQNPSNLEYFGKRINGFKAKNAMERECLRLAKQAHALYLQYPNVSCYRNAKPRDEYGEGEEYEVIPMDRLVSFCHRSDDWLSHSLIESVNAELCEYGDVEEPAITKKFNGKKIRDASLDFEHRLFALLDDLIYLLRNI